MQADHHPNINEVVGDRPSKLSDNQNPSTFGLRVASHLLIRGRDCDHEAQPSSWAEGCANSFAASMVEGRTLMRVIQCVCLHAVSALCCARRRHSLF